MVDVKKAIGDLKNIKIEANKLYATPGNTTIFMPSCGNSKN